MSDNSNNYVGNCNVCKSPAERKCSACKLVYYCNADHQKQDWKLHKNDCKPYEVCCSSEIGKYLRATRDLDQGDIIFTEAPLVFGPKPHTITEGPFPCVGCCKLINSDKCSQCPNCGWPCCSPDCEGLTDSNYHELECRILRLRTTVDATSFYEYFRFDILIVLRALFLQASNKTKWNHLLSLEDHSDKRGPGTEIFETNNEKAKYLEEKYLNPFKDYEKELGKSILSDVTNELIHKIYSIFDVNATELTENIDAEILYPTASLLEHNCIPNTTQSIDEEDNFKITFRASLPIVKGEHITSMYTHILWGTHARREHLLQTKYFSCSCVRCRDPTELGTLLSALRCLGTETEPCGGTQLPLKPLEEKTKWVCNKCKIQLPSKDIIKFVNHLSGEVDKVLSKKPSIQELEEILEKLLNFLHPNHYLIYTIKHTLVQLYGNPTENDDGIESSTQIIIEKIQMCNDLIEITKKIDPGNSRLSIYLAILLNELFKGKFTILQRSFALENKENFANGINEIKDLLEESKVVLKYESKSNPGLQLLDVVCGNELKFKNWLNEN